MTERKLFTHQKDGVRFLVTHKSRAIDGRKAKGVILADDMGLGKTTTSLVAAKVHQDTQGAEIIVICPPSLQRNWHREAAIVKVKIKVYSSGSIPATKKTGTDNKEYFVAADTLPEKYVLIADEAQLYQNPSSQRTQKFLAVAKKAIAVYPLSGTPIKNGRPINLLPLLMAIEHPIAKNSREYQVRYCNARLVEFRVKNVKDGTYEQRTVWKNDESSNLPELHEKIKPVLLRRMKNECLDLPPKIRSFIETDLDANEKAKYDQVFREMRERYHQRLRNNEIDGTADTLVMINNLRRAGSIAKINTAIALADEVLEQGGQVIIFTEFLDSARAIAAHYGTKPLEGSLSMGGRDKLVEDFQSGKTKVFVGMGGAGGVGLNLFKGQTVILVDRPWSPDVFQLEDRAHRIGQTGTVNCLWIQYGKMDDMIDETILWKFSNTSEILHGKPSTIPFVNNVQFSKELASKLFA